MEHIEVRLIALYRDGGTRVYEDRNGTLYYEYRAFAYADRYPPGTILSEYPKSGELGRVKVLENGPIKQVCAYNEPWPPQITTNVQSGSYSSESQHTWPEDHNLSHYISKIHPRRT